MKAISIIILSLTTLLFAYEPVKCKNIKLFMGVDNAIPWYVDKVVQSPSSYTCGVDAQNVGTWIFVYRNKMVNDDLVMFTYVEHQDGTVWANYYYKRGFSYDRYMYSEYGYQGERQMSSGEFKRWLHKNQDEM